MEFTIRRDTFDFDEDLQRLVDLQNVVYKDRGLHFTKEGFKFWYTNNPLGKVYSFNAYDGGRMVSHYACSAVDWVFYGRRLPGLLSMAVATHPDYRKQGLFVKLAQMTYDCARGEGMKFVIGVANANSIHALTKYLGHKFIANLEVKWGWGDIIYPENKFIYRYIDDEILNWRLNKPQYSRKGDSVYGIHSVNFGIKTFMGKFDNKLLQLTNVPFSNNLLRPFNLYVGLGADLSKGHYFDFPSFVNHSPFHLHLLDLSGGDIPEVTKNNIVFQLIDFDVA